jgi:hypothetical protein
LDRSQHLENVVAAEKSDSFIAMVKPEPLNNPPATLLCFGGKGMPFSGIVVRDRESIYCTW